eukprot:ANDGO_01121.mRNA.1 hypothetical protein
MAAEIVCTSKALLFLTFVVIYSVAVVTDVRAQQSLKVVNVSTSLSQPASLTPVCGGLLDSNSQDVFIVNDPFVTGDLNIPSDGRLWIYNSSDLTPTRHSDAFSPSPYRVASCASGSGLPVLVHVYIPILNVSEDLDFAPAQVASFSTVVPLNTSSLGRVEWATGNVADGLLSNTNQSLLLLSRGFVGSAASMVTFDANSNAMTLFAFDAFTGLPGSPQTSMDSSLVPVVLTTSFDATEWVMASNPQFDDSGASSTVSFLSSSLALVNSIVLGSTSQKIIDVVDIDNGVILLIRDPLENTVKVVKYAHPESAAATVPLWSLDLPQAMDGFGIAYVKSNNSGSDRVVASYTRSALPTPVCPWEYRSQVVLIDATSGTTLDTWPPLASDDPSISCSVDPFTVAASLANERILLASTGHVFEVEFISGLFVEVSNRSLESETNFSAASHLARAAESFVLLPLKRDPFQFLVLANASTLEEAYRVILPEGIRDLSPFTEGFNSSFVGFGVIYPESAEPGLNWTLVLISWDPVNRHSSDEALIIKQILSSPVYNAVPFVSLLHQPDPHLVALTETGLIIVIDALSLGVVNTISLEDIYGPAQFSNLLAMQNSSDKVLFTIGAVTDVRLCELSVTTGVSNCSVTLEVPVFGVSALVEVSPTSILAASYTHGSMVQEPEARLALINLASSSVDFSVAIPSSGSLVCDMILLSPTTVAGRTVGGEVFVLNLETQIVVVEKYVETTYFCSGPLYALSNTTFVAGVNSARVVLFSIADDDSASDVAPVSVSALLPAEGLSFGGFELSVWGSGLGNVTSISFDGFADAVVVSQSSLFLSSVVKPTGVFYTSAESRTTNMTLVNSDGSETRVPLQFQFRAP